MNELYVVGLASKLLRDSVPAAVCVNSSVRSVLQQPEYVTAVEVELKPEGRQSRWA